VLDFINVSKTYGGQVILDGVSLHIGSGERIGLVGANGSGKTTLFRLICAEETPDAGMIQQHKGLRIGFLQQEIQPGDEGTVLTQVLSARPEYHEVYLTRLALQQTIEGGNPDDDVLRRKAYTDALYEDLGGDAVKARAESLLTGLGFTPETSRGPLHILSGGWHMRVRLAYLLMAEPDLLLLDEPTNHLDLPSMVWFEQYLAGFSGSYVVIAHDREFINRTVSRVVEVEAGRLSQYSGNYDFYRIRKVEELEHRFKAWRTQQARIREIEDFIARNRVRKDRAKQVQSRFKMLEKIQRIELPAGSRGIGFSFPQPDRSGAQALCVEEIHKSFGEKVVFNGENLAIPRGEKVALVGINGMGKSTLLKIIAGLLEPDAGTCTLGHNVSVGYFAQHQLEALAPEHTVQEEFFMVTRDETLSQVRAILGAFLFSGDDVEKKVGVLSGGEKSRLALARLLVRPANFLIMDEPTNHLDIASREVLEEALQQYSGTLLFASHDRRFIDAIATRIIEMDGGRMTEYLGNYTDYAWKKDQENELEAPGLAQSEARIRSVRDERKAHKRHEAELRKVLYREVRPLAEKAEDLEARVEDVETQIGGLEKELASPVLYATAPEKARDKAATVVRLRRELDELMDSWEAAALLAEEAEVKVRSRFEDLS
jgi:ATP-binding cassette, subfamily F, member 3